VLTLGGTPTHLLRLPFLLLRDSLQATQFSFSHVEPSSTDTWPTLGIFVSLSNLVSCCCFFVFLFFLKSSLRR
jgi:hypothetical protein